MEKDKVYIVASFTNTIPGKIIRWRASLKFWNRYEGDIYSHISLSHDKKLGNMKSFARKDLKNPFNSGLITEDIRKGMFALKPDSNEMAVMELKVSEMEYNNILDTVDRYWKEKEKYGFNYAGVTTNLICGKGVRSKNNYFCSQWVTTVLKESGINLFGDRKPEDIKPFDFYGELNRNIIYEGLVAEYPEYNDYPTTEHILKQELPEEPKFIYQLKKTSAK